MATTLHTDAAELSAVVRRALKVEQLQILEWACSEMHRGSSGSEVYVLEGMAEDLGRQIPWSIVVKRVLRADGEPDPEDAFYWQREHVFFESGILSSAPIRAVVPPYVGSTAPHDGEVRLWFRTVNGPNQGMWNVSHFRRAAWHLGRLNGYFRTRPAECSRPWMTRGLLRRWVVNLEELETTLSTASHHPMVRDLLPTGVSHVGRLIHERDHLLDVLYRLPQTLCHLDCHRRNIGLTTKARSESAAALDGAEPVFFDWALAGVGALGQDLGPLVTVSAFMFDTGTIPLDVLDAETFDAYMAGLDATACHEKPEAVRLGYVVDAVLRFLNRTRFLAGFLKHPEAQSWWEEVSGRPAAESIARHAEMLPYMLGLVNEIPELLSVR